MYERVELINNNALLTNNKFEMFEEKIQTEIDVLKTIIRSSQEHLDQKENEILEFISDTNANIEMLQLYIEKELLSQRIISEISKRQVEELMLAPWYKKLFQSQRDKIMKEVSEFVTNNYEPNVKELSQRMAKLFSTLDFNVNVEEEKEI